MQRRLLIATVFLLTAAPLSANPVSPYEYPVISEVQWIDPVTWSIEVNGDMWSNITADCTTDLIRLYIASSRKFYSTQVTFNKLLLGIITPASITGIEENEQVMLQKRDTIFIPEGNAESVFDCGPEWEGICENGWLCILDSPQSGNSLIGIGGGKFRESSRNSLGYGGDYTTLNHLQVLDRNSQSFPGIYLSRSAGYGPVGTFYEYYHSIGYTDTIGRINVTASIGQGTGYCLSDIPVQSPAYSQPYPHWGAAYVDTATEVYDTVVYAPNFHKVTVTDNLGNPVPSLSPMLDYYPLLSIGSHIGDTIGEGIFLFRLFEGNEYVIYFYNLPDTLPVAACYCSYSDTPDTICHTVEASTVARSHPQPLSASPPIVAFSALSGKDHTVRFVIAHRCPVINGTVEICSLDGRTIATLNLSPGHPGTHTIFWNGTGTKSGKVSPGRYICRLRFNGKTVGLKNISLL